MQAEYLYRTMLGSEWIPCEIVKPDVPKTKDHWSLFDHIFGYNESELGHIVRVYDRSKDKKVELWACKDCVKFPHVSEWIGL